MYSSIDDLLADTVIEARVTFRGLACTGWGIAGGTGCRIGFHAILSGECWVRTPASDAPTRASAGGLLVYRPTDRKSTRLNSSHTVISYAVFCLKKKSTTNAYFRCSCTASYSGSS